MKKKVNLDSFIENSLDQITSSGEKFGFTLGSMGRLTKRVVIGVGVLLVFGAAAFIWAMFQGITKKKQ